MRSSGKSNNGEYCKTISVALSKLTYFNTSAISWFLLRLSKLLHGSDVAEWPRGLTEVGHLVISYFTPATAEVTVRAINFIETK